MAINSETRCYDLRTCLEMMAVNLSEVVKYIFMDVLIKCRMSGTLFHVMRRNQLIAFSAHQDCEDVVQVTSQT
jgi:hypothetical protein